MSFWWIDRALPGVIDGLIVSLAVALSHVLLHRHITKTTERQTAALTGSAPAETDTEEGRREL